MPCQALSPAKSTSTSRFPGSQQKKISGTTGRIGGAESPPLPLQPVEPHPTSSARLWALPASPPPLTGPRGAAKEPTHRPPPSLRAPVRSDSPPESWVENKRWNPSPAPQTRLNFPAAVAAAAYWPVLATWTRLPWLVRVPWHRPFYCGPRAQPHGVFRSDSVHSAPGVKGMLAVSGCPRGAGRLAFLHLPV